MCIAVCAWAIIGSVILVYLLTYITKVYHETPATGANREPIQEKNRQQENEKFYSNLIKSNVSLNTVELEPEFYSVNELSIYHIIRKQRTNEKLMYHNVTQFFKWRWALKYNNSPITPWNHSLLIISMV